MKIPLIHKGKMKKACQIKPGDYITITGNIFDTEVVTMTVSSGDEIRITTKDTENDRHRTKKFLPGHIFLIYQPYPQKG
jgi:hypothetical protein